jgi:tetratricopeptide (TPR) repeat protein
MARHLVTDAGSASGSQDSKPGTRRRIRRLERALMQLRQIGLLVLSMLLCSPTLTPAQADPALDTARAQFARGIARAKQGHWPEALAAFSEAYRLAPEQAVLFNLAGAQFRCGKLLASNTNYRRLLASADERLSRAERQAVERQILQIELRMPRLRLHIQGLREGDRVLLDQVRVYADELDRDMWLDPGTHQVRVIRVQGRPESRVLSVAEGERRTMAFSLP